MAADDARKLFVAGLPESITEEVLRELFAATGGTVVDVSLPKDRMTGRPRGFGFVTLSTPEEAVSARGALDGSVQVGRAISVRPFSSEPPRLEARSEAPSAGAQSGDRTLYVGNLPYDVTPQEIEQLLAEHGAGPAQRVHLPNNPDGRPRGFGFVAMQSADAANAAIAALQNVEVKGRRLLIKIAHPRGERSTERGPSMPPRSSRFESTAPADEPEAMGPSDFFESARPVEGRRARSVEGKTRAVEGKKKKSKKKGRGERSDEGAERRRSNPSRQGWGDWDED
jgi:RNA recognition motif-containing protein